MTNEEWAKWKNSITEQLEHVAVQPLDTEAKETVGNEYLANISTAISLHRIADLLERFADHIITRDSYR